MKRFILLVLALTLCLSLLAGCDMSSCNGGGNGGGGSKEPSYSVGLDGYMYDADYHWKKDDKSDKKSHVNDLGRCRCGLYYETDDLVYELKEDDNGNAYYTVSAYQKSGLELDCHVEVPAYHQEPSDSEPIPVLAIESNVFNPNMHDMMSILSIKLNEGLKTIGGAAFAYSSIKELVIPNSVKGKLYHICGGCKQLETVVIGNGVEVLDGYCFSGCEKLKNVTIGNNVKELQRRVFYECDSLQRLVIPKSVVSIPEYEIYSGAVGKYISLYNIFEGGSVPSIFLEITKSEYDALIIPKLTRNTLTGLVINQTTGEDIPHDVFTYTTYGYVDGWCSVAPIYYVGEWHYDESGIPVPN